MSWQTLGSVAPQALLDARLQLHWAAQVIAAVAGAWIEKRPDDSHTNLQWREELGALLGGVTSAGLGVALRPAAFELLIVDADGAPVESFPLAGRSLPEALGWAEGQLAARAGAARGAKLLDYDMPEHPVRSGRAFAPEPAALAELARWFANADGLLRGLAEQQAKALPVRCWPHHFDIASIAYLDGDLAPEQARQIGFGVSPGDAFYAEPYCYLTPWPIAEGARLPPLEAGGHWHTQGFTGAILTGSALCAGAFDAGAQRERALGFFGSAFAAARTVIRARS